MTEGQTIDAVSDRSFTYTGVNLECLSPVYFNGSKDPVSGDISIAWVRRTRLGGEWRDAVDASLSETSEAYAVDIFSDGAYTTIKRTVSTTVPNFTYTSAMQTADFGVSQTQLCVMIYQVSETVGRGFPKKAWIPVQLENPPWASAVLAHMDDVGLTDVYGHYVGINGAAARSSAQSKFGGYAMVSRSVTGFDSVGYGIPATHSGSFCCEAFVYFTDLFGGSPYIFRCGSNGFYGWLLQAINQKLSLITYNNVSERALFTPTSQTLWYRRVYSDFTVS